MSEYTVAKFGGTSMTQPEQVAGIVMSDESMHAVVVSAPGREPGVDKMTERLYAYAEAVHHDDAGAASAIKDEVIDRFDTKYDSLGNDTRKLLRGKLASRMEMHPGLSKQETETMYVALGETSSAEYFAALIGAPCIGATCIRFDTSGIVDYANTQRQIARRVETGSFVDGRVVVPGFYGFDINGRKHLLDRGGSDRTPAIIGRSLEQIVGGDVTYQNWTDRDGIYTADPDKVPLARVIPELSRKEVREGAHSGTEVLQGDTILDLDGSQVVTVIKNTFNPKAPGTRIVPTRVPAPNESVVAISARDDLTVVTVEDMGMSNRPGYMAAREEYLGQHGMDVKRHADSEDSFSFITIAKTPEEKAALEGFCEYAQSQLVANSASVTMAQKGLVSVVGEGLQNPDRRNAAQIRILGEVSARRARAQDRDEFDATIEDTLTAPGSPVLSFLVSPEDVLPIVRAIHEREFERNHMPPRQASNAH